MTRIDAHLHVWRAAGGETPGISTIVSPQTDVPIADAARTLAEHGIDRAVLVQPVFPGEDNSYVASCAREQPQKFAAVCVVDPRTPGAEKRLEHWVRQGCRGLRLRPRLPDEDAVFGDPSTFALWQTAQALRVVVSILASPEHIPRIADLAQRFPEVPIVVDHLAHPNPVAGIASLAFQQLLDLADHPQVFIKVSGWHHFSARGFPFDDCRDLLRTVYERFGPGRLIWGSDFPHVTRAGGYAANLRLVDALFDDRLQAERDAVMGGNAHALYWPAERSP